jgi:UDP-glucose 4-epimerase
MNLYDNFLITGGSGFIGESMSRCLLRHKKGLILSDIQEPDIDLLPYFSYCDVTDYEQVKYHVKKVDAVIHLAANPSPRLAEQNPMWDMNINVKGTYNVARACAEYDKYMFYSSTAQISVNPYSCYAISKRTGEMYMIHEFNKKGLKGNIGRFWNIFGASQPLGYVVPDFIDKLVKSEGEYIDIIGTGKDVRDFVYIEDLTDAIRMIIGKGTPGGTYEVGTGVQRTINDLALVLGSLMYGKYPVLKPSREGGSMVLYEQNLSPIESIGWTPRVSFKDGLRKILYSVGWYNT